MEITVELVRRLVAEQFPQWSDLPLTPVPAQGNDNRTFRLGAHLSVRLPSHECYVAGVAKEDRVLPLLGEHLSTPVPMPEATGRPTEDYPHPWSVRRWLPGDTADRDPHLDRTRFARDLGTFLTELRAVPAHRGPAAGLHSFHRGCHPGVYEDQVEEALRALGDAVDADTCRAIWREAMTSTWAGPAVWFHGDVAAGNLLTASGRLCAVIDFGTCGVGDPACDLVIAWTFLGPEQREVFRDAAGLPDDAWARARGWALWKALIGMVDGAGSWHDTHARTLGQLMAEASTGRATTT